MYKFTHDVLHGDNVRYYGGIVGGVCRMIENTEQKHHNDRTDAAEGNQTETVAGAILVTSR